MFHYVLGNLQECVYLLGFQIFFSTVHLLEWLGSCPSPLLFWSIVLSRSLYFCCYLLLSWIRLSFEVLVSLLLFMLPEPRLPIAISHLSSLCYDFNWALLSLIALSYMFIKFISFFHFHKHVLLLCLSDWSTGVQTPFIQSCVRIKKEQNIASNEHVLKEYNIKARISHKEKKQVSQGKSWNSLRNRAVTGTDCGLIIKTTRNGSLLLVAYGGQVLSILVLNPMRQISSSSFYRSHWESKEVQYLTNMWWSQWFRLWSLWLQTSSFFSNSILP